MEKSVRPVAEQKRPRISFVAHKIKILWAAAVFTTPKRGDGAGGRGRGRDKAPWRLISPFLKSHLVAFSNKPTLDDLQPLGGKYLQHEMKIRMGFRQKQKAFQQAYKEGPRSQLAEAARDL